MWLRKRWRLLRAILWAFIGYRGAYLTAPIPTKEPEVGPT